MLKNARLWSRWLIASSLLFVSPALIAQNLTDSSPCPKNYMFNFGGLYFFSTVNCTPVGGGCSESASTTIKAYTEMVVTGCRPVEGSACQCANSLAPTLEIQFRPIRVYAAARNSTISVPHNPAGKLEVSNEMLVRIKSTAQPETFNYFHCFRIRYTSEVAGKPETLEKGFSFLLMAESNPAAVGLKMEEGIVQDLEGEPCIVVLSQGVFFPVRVE